MKKFVLEADELVCYERTSLLFCLFKMPGRGHINSISVVPDLTNGEKRDTQLLFQTSLMERRSSSFPLRPFSLFNHPPAFSPLPRASRKTHYVTFQK